MISTDLIRNTRSSCTEASPSPPNRDRTRIPGVHVVSNGAKHSGHPVVAEPEVEHGLVRGVQDDGPPDDVSQGHDVQVGQEAVRLTDLLDGLRHLRPGQLRLVPVLERSCT
jgi:hypothetical protein